MSKIKILFFILIDLIVLYLALFVSLLLRYSYSIDPLIFKLHAIPFGINFVLWILVFGALELYNLRSMKNNKYFLLQLLEAMAINAGISALFFYFMPFFQIEPRKNLFIILFFSTIFIFIWRTLLNLFVIRAPATKLVFFGVNKEILDLADYLTVNPQLGQRPVACLPVEDLQKDLKQVLRETKADAIIITSEIKKNDTLAKALIEALTAGVSIIEFTTLYEMITGKIPLSMIQETWFLENLVVTKKRLYESSKRTLDLILAFVVGIIGILLFPFIATAIKLDSVGPIFFKQKRVGKNGKNFLVIKYRSMEKNAENMSGFKGKGEDPRHTKVGSFLRKSYMDEIPQIINILKGEMSFVGPRPERPEYVDKLKTIVPFYEMRLLALPGITGWAQTNMENDASVEDAPQKMQYDLYYIKNRSFILDLLIAIRTIFTILRREGR